MLIKQIIEFQLGGPWPLAYMYSYNWLSSRQKNVLRKIFEWIIIYC